MRNDSNLGIKEIKLMKNQMQLKKTLRYQLKISINGLKVRQIFKIIFMTKKTHLRLERRTFAKVVEILLCS